MSELINNREFRKEAIRNIIMELHNGKPVQAVKDKFDELIKDLAPGELSQIEQSLINEGLAIPEVQRLCDVHAAVFRDALEQAQPPEATPGHPIYTFKRENEAIERLINNEIKPLLSDLAAATGEDELDIVWQLTEDLNLLLDIDKHYSRKENLLFPYLEKYEITGPPKVMWGVDDEIRAALKATKDLSMHYQPQQKEQLLAKTQETLERITDMVFKEEKILLPMALETLTEDEWYQILDDSDEIGFCLIEPEEEWRPQNENVTAKVDSIADTDTRGHIKFATGVLTPNEIGQIFNHLPVDITFVDKDNVVKFFSAPKERIFPRTRTVIGRRVENCHPPASVHIVEQIVSDFKQGVKDHEDFWIKMGSKYILIRYFAVRDDDGKYLGTLEVTQDIQPLQEISGQKRIAD